MAETEKNQSSSSSRGYFYPLLCLVKKGVDGVVSALMAWACLVLVFLIVITCIDVVGRYFLNSPLQGSTELTEMALAVLVFTSLPIITYHQRHIVVDILDSFLSPKLRFFIAQVSYGAIAFGFYYLAQVSDKLATRALRRGTLTEYLEIPQGYLIMFAQYTCYITIGLMVVLIVQNFICQKQFTINTDV